MTEKTVLQLELLGFVVGVYTLENGFVAKGLPRDAQLSSIRENRRFLHFYIKRRSPCLTLPYLASPRLASPRFTSPCSLYSLARSALRRSQKTGASNPAACTTVFAGLLDTLPMTYYTTRIRQHFLLLLANWPPLLPRSRIRIAIIFPLIGTKFSSGLHNSRSHLESRLGPKIFREIT